jgi:hypothetical protein
MKLMQSLHEFLHDSKIKQKNSVKLQVDRKREPLQIYCIQETDFVVLLLDFAKKEIVLGPVLPKLVQVLAN